MRCGGLLFTSNFDSGNFDKVERVVRQKEDDGEICARIVLCTCVGKVIFIQEYINEEMRAAVSIVFFALQKAQGERVPVTPNLIMSSMCGRNLTVEAHLSKTETGPVSKLVVICSKEKPSVKKWSDSETSRHGVTTPRLCRTSGRSDRRLFAPDLMPHYLNSHA